MRSGVVQKLKHKQRPQPGAGSTASSVCDLGQDIIFGNSSVSLSAACRAYGFASDTQESVYKALYRIINRVIKQKSL